MRFVAGSKNSSLQKRGVSNHKFEPTSVTSVRQGDSAISHCFRRSVRGIHSLGNGSFGFLSFQYLSVSNSSRRDRVTIRRGTVRTATFQRPAFRTVTL
jgi:hypothetical protein